MGQGLKTQGVEGKESMSAAVLGQAHESEGLTSEDVKPHSASQREEDLQSSKHDRGESVEPHKPIDEVSGATGTRCCAPVEGIPSGVFVAHSPRSSNFGNTGIPR